MAEEQNYIETTAEHFETFKAACADWQRRLGLTDWRIYYRHVERPSHYSQCHYRQSDHIATIDFTTRWDALRPLNDAEIVAVARHECLHLLTADLNNVALDRHASEDRIEEIEEHLVHRIEALLDRECPK